MREFTNYFTGEIMETTSCNCIGTVANEPKCPCMMSDVIKRGGWWIQQERDLGPVISELPKIFNVRKGANNDL